MMKPVVLCILDGWGWREDSADNAVRQAKTPAFDRLWQGSPHAFLKTSGLDVGLPDGQMGNSEVGHMNIGAGRVVFQDLPRIDLAVADGSLAQNPVLVDLCAKAAAGTGTIHLLGLVSPGGVHSHQAHIAALARILSAAGRRVYIHALLDGRDVAPTSAPEAIRTLLNNINGLPGVALATLCGRYFTMDRDKRWERVQKGYDLLVAGTGMRADDPLAAIASAHAAGQTDEFIEPIVLPGYDGMKDGDSLVIANFRADRVRQIGAALLDPAFTGFARTRMIRFAAAAGMTEYSNELNRFLATLFPSVELNDTLGHVVAAAGRTQLRLAETEKYPHVTYFLNGGLETPFAGEDRSMVPSPKVATYDLQPEMSCGEVTDRLVEAVKSMKYDLIVINYANPDMVGHTGILAAAIRAVEAVDGGLGRLMAALDAVGGCALVTADHGNCELMRDPVTGGPHTSHTTNPVPLALYNGPAGVVLADGGRLADVAPTLLALMGLPQPAAMTGRSLLS